MVLRGTGINYYYNPYNWNETHQILKLFLKYIKIFAEITISWYNQEFLSIEEKDKTKETI